MKNLFLILLIFSISCINQGKEPDYVIPKEDMVEIIIDLHLADGMLSVNEIRQELVRKDTINYYEAILDAYGYNRSDFDTSVYYYSKHIDKYDQIYGEVLNRLNEMETELKKEDEESDKNKKDTIRVGRRATP